MSLSESLMKDKDGGRDNLGDLVDKSSSLSEYSLISSEQTDPEIKIE